MPVGLVPTWRALPLWAKIVIAPLVLSATITIILVATYTLAGLLTVTGNAIEGGIKYFRKAKGTVVGGRTIQAGS